VTIPSVPAERTVVVDANVLINLFHVGRLDILGTLAGFAFVVTEHVLEEMVRLPQRADVNATMEKG